MSLNNHPKVKKIIFISLIFIIALPAAYFSFIYFKKANAQGQMPGMPEPQVNVITLQKQKFDDFEELPARVVTVESAEVRPQVNGIITKILFKEGSKVNKGDQLYQIDPSQIQADYNIAKADLEKAKANLEAVSAKNKRYRELIQTDSISKQEYDDIMATFAAAKADVEVAKAAADKAKVYLDYTKVFAPIDGYISKTFITRGSLVSAGQAESLATITQLDPIYVDIQRPSEDIADFKNQVAGKDKVEVDLVMSDGTIYPHKGTLQFSEVNVDPTTSAVSLRAKFDNPENALLPGSFVQAKVKINTEDALLIPQKITTRNPDGSLSVWVVNEQSVANPVIISVAKASETNWIVKGGIKEGDTIVVDGFQKLAPNSKVKIISPEEK